VEAAPSANFLSLLTPEAIAALLESYVGTDTPDLPRICGQLATYLDLILKWNAKLNLTAIRTPEEVVRRHFGESLFAGAHLGPCSTLLDFGSGAGFPGIPIRLLRPEVAVTLAESQGKKAAFLREAVRTLGLTVEVYASRVELMPASRRFDTVTLRAVDNMESAVLQAANRAERQIVILGALASSFSGVLSPGFLPTLRIAVPGSTGGVLEIFGRT
jgi:16S rRNA (guanine527-N7)-methyltransferase